MKLSKLPIFFSCILLLLVCGCSTTNHALLPTQAYLDITSHYNAYFNANEKLKGALKTVEESHKEKFDSVIAVYYYSDPKEFAAYTSDLDDVIKRSTLAIQLRGASNWSDDHLLLVGISYYLKGDYDKANGSFKYITTEYKEGVDYVKVMKNLGKKVKKYVKKKKKKTKPEVKVITMQDGTKKLEKVNSKPKFSLWIHEPARSEALIWLIKAYTRQKNYDAAASIVTYAKNDDLFYQNLEHELDLAEADLHVSRGDYAAAIVPLEKYLNSKKVIKRKRLRVRPLFVLAQCYQQTDNNAKAIENYKLVLKSRPNYDMEFYAKIKMAKLGRGSEGGNEEIKKLLFKMGADGKYREYWDQIFYELALIMLDEKENQYAEKLLRKSINKSVSNDDQKALSFLKLAELNYHDEYYVTSKYYYDSTLIYMAKNDLRYPDIEERDKLLAYLVTQLDIIYTEDSLQKLAALPKEERDKVIKTEAARIEKEAEDKKAQEEADKQQGLPNNQLNPNTNSITQNTTNTSNSSWYFYNTNARATGYNDFIKRWGRRKLEENWRRKNKSSISIDEDVSLIDTTSSSQDTAGVTTAGTLEEKLLAGVPTTPAKLEKSSARLIDAYYTAGTIYKDGLENYSKAETMFETLNSRFPQNKLLLESYYNLYLIALKTNHPAKAEGYKNKILAEFPESIIAKVLRDPNYVNEAKRKEQAVFSYYEMAFNDYSSNQLDSAWYKCQMADNIFNPNPISAKFQLLNALVYAKQNRLADYVQALNKIINTTKDAEVKKTADALLTALNKSSLPQIDLSKDSTQRAVLNSQYVKPDSSETALLQKLNAAKELAKQSGVTVQVDTTSKEQKPQVSNEQTTVKDTTEAKAETTQVINTPPAEDTTSVYIRSDVAVHYFIIFIKDPQTPQSSIMSTVAKINAFNSTQFSEKKLTAKQIPIDSKNKLINVRQFKNREEALSYYNVIKSQTQLFSDMQPNQYAITCVSTVNWGTFLEQKNVDEYNKFFNRVYK